MLRTLAFVASCSAALTPVVLVPGDGGSQLEARLDKPSVKHFYCKKKADWFRLWLSVSFLLPGAIDCWSDNIQLDWNSTTETYSNRPGVFTRTPGFGDTSSVESLDPSVPGAASKYLKPVVDALVASGFERNVSVRAAPYDFRYAPTSTEGNAYLARLKTLVEETYTINGDRKVALVSHSMGCLYSLYFLNHQTQDWKDKYIKHWYPTSGVFGGSANEIRLYASGNNEGIPGVKGTTIRQEQRSYQTNFWLFPSPDVFGSEVIATTSTRNFTSDANGVRDFFSAINFEEGIRQFELAMQLTKDLPAPHVNTTHFYGTEVDTPAAYDWSKVSDFNSEPQTIMGAGDGTVNLVSLKSVDKWSTEQPEHTYQSQSFPGQCHNCILSDAGYLSELTAALTQQA